MRFEFLLTTGLAVGLAAHAAQPVPAVQRFHSYTPSLAAAGQPARAQFAAIAAAGYKVVINVASPDSNPDAIRDEKQLVEAAGMEYFHMPLKWEKPDVNQVVEAVNLLESLGGKPVLVHCYVNSRASLVAYLHRTMRGGAPEADEKQTLTRIWKQNRGYEFENSPQWQLLIEDAKERLGKK